MNGLTVGPQGGNHASPICYLRLISGNAEKIAKALCMSGFDVLGVHRIGGEENGVDQQS